MKKESLKYLSKKELIEIITSNDAITHKAFIKVIAVVHEKVNDIIDEQEKCDLHTASGRKKYFELEKEYKKWSEIQENL